MPRLRAKDRKPYVHRAWNNNWRVYLPVAERPLASHITEHATHAEALGKVKEYYQGASA
jgi:hypothetical protein